MGVPSSNKKELLQTDEIYKNNFSFFMRYGFPNRIWTGEK
jgi:hypothetical protein